jgi:DNA replication protein DnaC
MQCFNSDCSNDAEPGTRYCPECRAKNEEYQKKVQLERIATIEKVWNGGDAKWIDIRPPKKYHGAIWNTIAAVLQKQIMPFVDGTDDLLTFVGCPGAGKTWAAWATAGVFLVNHAETYFYNHNYHGNHFFTNWYVINEAARDSRLFGEEGEGNREWLDRLAAAELLVIDEFATARPYEAEFMGVMRIIHHRFDNGLPTILITTKSEQQISEIIGEAMVSRINSGVMVRMQGRDRRLRK